MVVIILRMEKEKDTTVEVEENKLDSICSSTELSPEDKFPNVRHKKTLVKLDFVVLPTITVLYLLAFIDRANIGNAKIEGLPDDLGLTGSQFNICLTVFFFPYAFFEVPANALLAKFSPSIWLPSIMVAWGVVMTLMGLVKNYEGLLVARIFLGVAEAGLYPGVAYYLTLFYKRNELQFRQSLFNSAASSAGAFSGILAWAIAKMNGLGGLKGWAWIFIIEGIATVLCAIGAYFLMCNGPHDLPLFTPEERQYIAYRVACDTQDDPNGNGSRRQQTVKALTDIQIYLQALIFVAATTCVYGISLFLPSIVKTMGYTASHAQLMTVPIYIVASIVSVCLAILADKVVKRRSPVILISMTLSFIGFTIAATTDVTYKPKVLYGAMILAASGAYATIPCVVAWGANNVTGKYKRAIALAIQIGIGNLGGAIGSNLFRAQDAPRYKLGHCMEIMFTGLGICITCILCLLYAYWNRQKKRALESGKYDGKTTEQIAELCDRSPFIKYAF